MSEKKRRKWTAAEKLRIVLTGMQPNVDVSEVCRREGINPTQFYGWKKRLLGSASQVFDERPKKPDAKQERLEQELARMKGVVAEITAEKENMEPKKRFRARRPRQDAAGVAATGAGGGGVDEAAERLACVVFQAKWHRGQGR
jgi:transposase